ncbi:72 kDa inositol polyphosphate 5-phosphatase [Termitomyces sp. J132]|nr:72 kDa inositol polyphosphate 5-phosphatase [Termitomyces sp. J132]
MPNVIPEKFLPPVPPPKSASTTRKALRCLKIRIVTWNMHDSVPKACSVPYESRRVLLISLQGDLEEFFGKVPLWSPSSSTSSGTIPNFPLEAVHPYHLVVVAGQECPSLSGIPMGLGAGLNKLMEKDKNKDRENLEKSRTRHKDKDEDQSHEPPSGWTSMIDDWLCQGSGTRTSSPTVADIGFPKPLAPRPLFKEPRKGPYQLLVKERMMGIYLAVFIHHGTTFLFLNAHLAAHEAKLNHRLSNLIKIKNELAVDDFLGNDDPRVMAEDLTDKFDHTFLFGDLNFRLDISRLHADWLLSRKEYAQALAFDQLTNLMKSGEAFVGFKEAPINFPPTFKYDVLRSLKHIKRGKSQPGSWRRPDGQSCRLTEVEKEVEDLEKKEAEEEAEEEATERDPEDEEVFTSPSYQTMASSTSKTSVAAVTHGVKARWLHFFSSHRIKPYQAQPRENVITKAHSSVDIISNGLLTPATAFDSIDPTEKTRLQPPRIISVNSTKSSLLSKEEDDNSDKGVYDSSHKKRVPSWCDRILWKSTVKPEPEPEEETQGPFWRPRTRTTSSTTLPSGANDHHDQVQRRMTESGATSSSLNLQQYPHLDTQPSASSSRWRFLPFFSHNTRSSTSIEPPSSADAVPAPRKGDVVCLSYHTLDDRGMRRLEGRSDHRPVIGSYVVYV